MKDFIRNNIILSKIGNRPSRRKIFFKARNCFSKVLFLIKTSKDEIEYNDKIHAVDPGMRLLSKSFLRPLV